MVVPRILFMLLRFAHFVCAAIVLGLASYLLHLDNNYPRSPNYTGPFGRLIYTLVIASISVVVSLVWTIPTTTSIVHWGTDLLFAAAWFSVFGVLQDWYDDVLRCGNGWDWGGVRFWGNVCGQWGAMQAFAFLSAALWFVSFVLGLLVWAKGRKTGVATDGAVTTAPVRQRGWFRRSRV